MSGEVIGYVKQNALKSGALDVYSTAIQMKKDRPGVIVSILCRPEDCEKFEQLLFQETGTLGFAGTGSSASSRPGRRTPCRRHSARFQGKLAWQPGGAPRFAPEFEDCARVAGEQGFRCGMSIERPKERSRVRRSRWSLLVLLILPTTTITHIPTTTALTRP